MWTDLVGLYRRVLCKTITVTSQNVCKLLECSCREEYVDHFFLAQQPPVGKSLHISRGFLITHNDASQSVGLFWTSDQLVAEPSTWQHTTLTRERHPRLRWDSKPQSQQASGRRPTPYPAAYVDHITWQIMFSFHSCAFYCMAICKSRFRLVECVPKDYLKRQRIARNQEILC